MFDSIVAVARVLIAMWLGILFLFLMWIGWCLWWKRGTDATPTPATAQKPEPTPEPVAPALPAEQLVEVGEAVLTVGELSQLTDAGFQVDQIQRLALIFETWHNVADIAH